MSTKNFGNPEKDKRVNYVTTCVINKNKKIKKD